MSRISKFAVALVVCGLMLMGTGASSRLQAQTGATAQTHAHAQAHMWHQHMQMIYQHWLAKLQAAQQTQATQQAAGMQQQSLYHHQHAASQQLANQSTLTQASTQQTSPTQSPTASTLAQDPTTNKYAHRSYASRYGQAAQTGAGNCQNARQSASANSVSQLSTNAVQDPSNTSQQCQKQQSLLVRSPSTQTPQQTASPGIRQQVLQQQALLNRQQLQDPLSTQISTQQTGQNCAQPQGSPLFMNSITKNAMQFMQTGAYTYAQILSVQDLQEIFGPAQTPSSSSQQSFVPQIAQSNPYGN